MPRPALEWSGGAAEERRKGFCVPAAMVPYRAPQFRGKSGSYCRIFAGLKVPSAVKVPYVYSRVFAALGVRMTCKQDSGRLSRTVPQHLYVRYRAYGAVPYRNI